MDLILLQEPRETEATKGKKKKKCTTVAVDALFLCRTTAGSFAELDKSAITPRKSNSPDLHKQQCDGQRHNITTGAHEPRTIILE